MSKNKRDKESATRNQMENFFKIAKNFSTLYNHDVYYVREAIKNLYLTKEGQANPYPAYQRLLNIVDNPNRRYDANCLASATYMSHVMNKMGVPSNVLTFCYDDEESKRSTYHSVLLYKYAGKFFVCDITYNSTFEKDFLLYCPYDIYLEIFPKLTGGSIDLEKAFIYDMDIKFASGKFNYLRLVDWDPKIYGLLSKTKLRERIEELKEERSKNWIKTHKGIAK